jgi:hypothetical protein
MQVQSCWVGEGREQGKAEAQQGSRLICASLQQELDINLLTWVVPKLDGTQPTWGAPERLLAVYKHLANNRLRYKGAS